MSAKQGQITSFFSRNKKQKTNNSFDGNSASVDILTNNFNDMQDETELCAEMTSLDPSETSTLASFTSPSPTTASLTSPSSTTASLTSPSSTVASLTSPSSTLALPTSPSSALASLTSSSVTSPSSTTALLTSPSSSTTASSTTKSKCEAICCTSDHLYVPQNQSDFKLSSDKRSCRLGWFLKYQWLTYCKVRYKN